MIRKDERTVQMTAKEYLEEIRELDNLIKTIKEQIEIETAKLTDTAVHYKEIQVQTSGAKDKIGERTPKIADFQIELEQYIQELQEKKSKALALIKKIPAKSQRLLILCYMQNKTMKEIEREMKLSHKSASEKKNKAVKEFEKIYEKNGDSRILRCINKMENI